MASYTMNKNISTFSQESDKDLQVNQDNQVNSKNEDYPILGSEDQSLKKSKLKKNKKTTNDVTKFFLSTSYNEVRMNKRPTMVNNSSDDRSNAFSTLENKEKIAKSLFCTRPCNNVKRENQDSPYGCCYRETCSFAHSMSEINDPMCSFDITCRFRWGKPQRDGPIDDKTKCQFRHSDETRQEWVKRTGRTLPDLPETSENTRKPTASKPTASKPTAHKNIKKDNPEVTVPTLVDSSLSETRIPFVPENQMFHWGKTVEKLEPIVDLVPTESECLSDLSESSELSESNDSKRYKRRRSRSRSPHKNSHSRSSDKVTKQLFMHVIRVPTSELAEVAIKAAFDRGVYNLQVIVD